MSDLHTIISTKDKEGFRKFLEESFPPEVDSKSRAEALVGAVAAYLEVVNGINQNYSDLLADTIVQLQALKETGKKVDEKFQVLKVKKELEQN